jgi:hypothetical protein
MVRGFYIPGKLRTTLDKLEKKPLNFSGFFVFKVGSGVLPIAKFGTVCKNNIELDFGYFIHLFIIF